MTGFIVGIACVAVLCGGMYLLGVLLGRYERERAEEDASHDGMRMCAGGRLCPRDDTCPEPRVAEGR